jgi:hypothetical protein
MTRDDSLVRLLDRMYSLGHVRILDENVASLLNGAGYGLPMLVRGS